MTISDREKVERSDVSMPFESRTAVPFLSVYLGSTKPAWNKIRCREISKFDWNNFFRQIGLTIDRTLKFFTVEIFENFPKNFLLS